MSFPSWSLILQMAISLTSWLNILLLIREPKVYNYSISEVTFSLMRLIFLLSQLSDSALNLFSGSLTGACLLIPFSFVEDYSIYSKFVTSFIGIVWNLFTIPWQQILSAMSDKNFNLCEYILRFRLSHLLYVKKTLYMDKSWQIKLKIFCQFLSIFS